MSCDVGEVTESLENEQSFTYVTAHSPTHLSLLLCHRLFTYVTWQAAHVTDYHSSIKIYLREIPRIYDHPVYVLFKILLAILLDSLEHVRLLNLYIKQLKRNAIIISSRKFTQYIGLRMKRILVQYNQ